MDTRSPHPIVPFDEIPEDQVQHFVPLTLPEAEEVKRLDEDGRRLWLKERGHLGSRIVEKPAEPEKFLGARVGLVPKG